MKLEPFSTGCGVLVHDIQLHSLSDDDLEQLKQAFSQHGLLLFRAQSLTPQQHLDFAKQMGKIVVNKFFMTLEHYPQIAVVKKEKQQTTNIGGGWHTDHSYDLEPAKASILLARQVPKQGGDTHFANLSLAYDALSQGMKKTLSNLRAVHSNEHIYGKDGYYSTTDLADKLTGQDSVGRATHPVVIRHPDTGRNILYVNPAHTIGFEGWSYEESKGLLDTLYKHVAQAAFTCAFDWQPGSVAIWDNRSTWHFAQNDYHGESREMHRITLEGGPLSDVFT